MLRLYIKHEIGQPFAPTRSRRLQKSWLGECRFITALAHLDFHDGMSLKMIVLTTRKQFLCQSTLDGLSVVNKKKVQWLIVTIRDVIKGTFILTAGAKRERAIQKAA